ncbi:two-component regulator propeller domain-containing protein [Bacteroides sp. 214]|uniref:hybrid sensor histidine kinase/response regulator transcription factor n=1 Tax=Bacteroides sp. 214 TaxID=2302935 RepID=UPI00351B3F18
MKHYSSNDGLTQNNVLNLIQDANEYIWMSTWNGLVRYDGYAFENFKTYPSDSIRMTNHRLTYIENSALNNIWCLTYNEQLYLFDTHKNSFEQVFRYHENIMVNPIRKVYVLANGITWCVGFKGELYRIDEANYWKKGAVGLYDHSNSNSLGDVIYNIVLDKDGDEWILSDKGVTIIGKKKMSDAMPFVYFAETTDGIYLATSKGYFVKYLPNGEVTACAPEMKMQHINALWKLHNGQILIAQNDGIIIYDPQTNTSKVKPTINGNHVIGVTDFYQDSQGIIWMMSKRKSIIRYDMEKDEMKFLDYPLREMVQDRPQGCFIHEDEYHCIWIRPQDGELCFYNTHNERMEQAYTLVDNKKEFCSFNLYTYLIDSHKNIWVATGDGFVHLTFSEKNFEYIYNNKHAEVRALCEDSKERLWVSEKPAVLISDSKVCLYDAQNNWLGNLSRSGEILKDPHVKFGVNIYSIFEDHEKNIWLGSRQAGLFRLQPTHENRYRITQFLPKETDPYSISSSSVYSIMQDSKKRIWIGTFTGGINLIDTVATDGKLRFIHAGNSLNNYPIHTCDKVRCMYETQNGTLLIGSTQGLISFSLEFQQPEAIRFYHNTAGLHPESLSNSDVLNICQGADGVLFVSTLSGGINRTSDNNLLSNDISFSHFKKNEEIDSDFSLSAIEDRKKNVWIASENGFARFNPANNSFDNYNSRSLKTRFKISEALPVIRQSGKLVFGTNYGALSIDPEKMRKSSFIPSIVFSDVEIYVDGSYRKQSLYSGERVLELAATERNVMISFAALDYTASDGIKYAYRMVGLSDEWMHVGHNRSAGFANLAAGNYEFQVQSTNGDGVWVDNITSMSVKVRPLFKETIWAMLLYALITIVLIISIVYILLYIATLRGKVNLEQKLTNLKLRFFTDISHELRTPLTLIVNPIEEVMNNEHLSEEGLENMQVAKKNANRMLQLINQILDFRKIQNNKMKIYLEEVDIVGVARNMFGSFKAVAHQRNINYQFVSAEKSCLMYTDVDKFEKIVYNLLSNAFKYTANNKSIVLTITITEDSFTATVKDDGKGFNVNHVNRLFARFETNNDRNLGLSTGIGLSLVNELLVLMHGTILVDSAPGKGSTFSITLPGKLSSYTADDNVELLQKDNIEKEGTTVADKKEEAATEVTTRSNDDRDTILVVEDNDELRHFILNILRKEYRTLEAVDGKQGLEITLNEIPDIIISDIMMPEMDGIEFLKSVKANRDTSHIPVILLSAKSSIEDRVQGLEYGADDYISKPFNSTYLKARVTSLLKQREVLYKLYINRPVDSKEAITVQESPSIMSQLTPSAPQVTNIDDEFLRTLIASIEEQMQNPEFRIDDLAETLNMSRTVFYRKIKSMVGVSPVDFVRNMRIKRSIQLLEAGGSSVSEIAYMCGFASPQYFSKVFKSMMNCSPKEYKRKK